MPKRETDYSRSNRKHYEESAQAGETGYGVWHKVNIGRFLSPEAQRSHYKLREKAKKSRPMPMGQGQHGRSRDVLK